MKHKDILSNYAIDRDRWHPFEKSEGWFPPDKNPQCWYDDIDEDGDFVKQFSCPIVVVDIHNIVRLAVFVWDYTVVRGKCREYFEDAYSGEEIEIKKWKYIF